MDEGNDRNDGNGGEAKDGRIDDGGSRAAKRSWFVAYIPLLLFIFIAKPLGRSLVVSLPPETAVFMEVPAENAGPVLHIARSFVAL